MLINTQKKYLVVGLESSCTKFVANLIAYNLGLIESYGDYVKSEDFIHDTKCNDEYLVAHRSLPFSARNSFIDTEYANNFDHVVLSIRDFQCSLMSKNGIHQRNLDKATHEHEAGRIVLQQLFKNLRDKITLFSYESAYILGQFYLEDMLKKLDLENPKTFTVQEINRKYIK